MRSISRIGWTLLAAGLLPIAACAKPGYYTGPASDHFDGARFFNPDPSPPDLGAMAKESTLGFAERMVLAHRNWPTSVPVTPSRPPAHVAAPGMRVTWIGHSTVLVQAGGYNILTDPVWSDHAFPVQFAGPARVRQPGVRFDDLPKIDLVLLSHDHYDHMDAPTLTRLWARDHPVIVTGLGNDRRLAGFKVKAIARDWGQSVDVAPGIRVTLVRAHHVSARLPGDRDATLWTGFEVTLPAGDLYFAGDTGPGDMKWAPTPAQGYRIRLALLPIGALEANGSVSPNHIDPAHAVTAFAQTGAGYALGVHWGTFELTDETIDMPRERLARAEAAANVSPDRFRTLEAGQPWDVPPLDP
jgi:L-ascorbate metabolism protein UlaG (beta-lactamase superfamily)